MRFVRFQMLLPALAAASALAFNGSVVATPVQVDFGDQEASSGYIEWMQPDGGDPDVSTGHVHRMIEDSYRNGWAGGTPDRRFLSTILLYEIPERPEGMFFDNASFTTVIDSVSNDPWATDLWGVGYRSTSEMKDEDWFAGSPEDSWFDAFAGTGDNIDDQVLIQESFIPAYPEADLGSYTTSAAGGGSLAGFLNLLYDEGAEAGDYAVLRLNFAEYADPNTDPRAWGFDGDGFELNGTLVPEPTSLGLLGAGGALMLMRRRQSRR